MIESQNVRIIRVCRNILRVGSVKLEADLAAVEVAMITTIVMIIIIQENDI